MRLVVMGVDPSTKCGIAFVDQDKKVVHAERIEFPQLTGMERIGAIAARIEELREKHKPDFTMIEDYAVSKFGGSAIVSIEVGALIRFVLWQDQHRLMEVAVGSLKKFVTDGGAATKDQMVLEVFKRFGYTAKNNDIADAVGLGMFGLCAGGVTGFPIKSRKVVVDALRTYPEFAASIGHPVPSICN